MVLEENRVRMRQCACVYVCEVEWLERRGGFRDGSKLG